MITVFDILKSKNIKLFGAELICVISPEDDNAYWFSKKGLPWGTRENPTFLQHRNYSDSDGITIHGEDAIHIIKRWGTH